MNDLDIDVVYNTMYKNYPDIVGAKDICSMLNIGKNNVYKLLREGKLSRIAGCKKILVAKINVINYVLQNTQK